MNDEKHTKGPWIVMEYTDGEIQICANGGNEKIAVMTWTTGGTPTENDRANAKLLAAAPELLEALREIRNEMSESGNTWEKSGKIALWKANEAIAKAEGR